MERRDSGWAATIVNDLSSVLDICTGTIDLYSRYSAADVAAYSQTVRNSLALALAQTEDICKVLNLATTRVLLERMSSYRNGSRIIQSEVDFRLAKKLVEELRTRFIDELTTRYVFIMPVGKERYYNPEGPLFGESVTITFPMLAFDISEAGNCFALGRNTASVFHLMRVMEQAVQMMGTKMKITLKPKEETWYQIMMHVENKIKMMSTKTTQQKALKARYAITAAHLNSVRIAWRNEVMHPKGTYTSEEAEEILMHVKTFMRDLADFL